MINLLCTSAGDWSGILQALPYIILAFFGIAEIIKVIDYFVAKHKSRVNQEVQRNQDEITEEQRIEFLEFEVNQLKEDQEKIKNDMANYQKNDCESFSSLNQKLDKLLQSDLAAHKSWFSRMHEETTKRGWISKYDLESVESRFAIYKEEGGNSFVKDLVEEMRDLPRK